MEVALALGIASFALVALLGALPVGLKTARAASDLNFNTLISQRLIGLLEQTSNSNYSALEASYFYFDDQGQPLKLDTSGAVPTSALYAASIQPAQADSNTNTLISGAITANAVTALQINIVTDPTHSLKGTPGATLPANLQSRTVVIPFFKASSGG